MPRTTHPVRLALDVHQSLIALLGIRRIGSVQDYASRAVREQLKRDGLDGIVKQALRLRSDPPITFPDSSTPDSKTNGRTEALFDG